LPLCEHRPEASSCAVEQRGRLLHERIAARHHVALLWSRHAPSGFEKLRRLFQQRSGFGERTPAGAETRRTLRTIVRALA
jgi:hypothetical protein